MFYKEWYLFTLTFEGTYRDKDYSRFTGETLSETHPFEILMSYSLDGKTWSNPTEVYTSSNNNSKSSAPFVCVTESNQIVISFQTDEDAVLSGYIGDNYSMMKVIISKPGIAIQDMNINSFYALSNPNNTPIGGASLWNGMMVYNNKLYTCSSGAHIKVSSIPLYDYQSLVNANINEYEVRNGSFKKYDDSHFITTDKQTLVISKDIEIKEKTIVSSLITPKAYQDTGLVFACNDNKSSYWEDSDYYVFLINKDGYLILGKIAGGNWSEIVSPGSEVIRKGFSLNNTYKLSITFDPSDGTIICYANNKLAFSTTDMTLNGAHVGFRSGGSGTIFSPLMVD